ncbi:hypothetical protein KOAAANKH_03866 [Brevundimonas sp. NIBR10]|uniref:COG3650 family protein n=1 Tax=Brevundimonas sp. NIBR10 TaxID=3015997 RepID=UPI0022F15726|nr:hypothetical protein [Brevundimonas sp. NIBR10]WGM48951.1 hypothetical protein KOAAANKH_03866 [Brevundimonas sp. NIBR10]
MRPIAAAPFIAVLALAACSEPASQPTSAPAPAPAAATLAGVDLNQPVRALGTEPFWGVEITASAITYTSIEGPPQTGTNSGPTLQGTTATYASTIGDQPIEITLIATECSDGMSDRTYPLTAMVKLGGETLNGCAASKAALEAQPPA